MSRVLPVPAGFTSHREGRCILVAEASRINLLRKAGLAEPSTWEALLSGAASGPGRGASARMALPGGTVALLKKMKRGGLAGPLWRNRFPGSRRLLANLCLPAEAGRRGVATAAPLALLLVEGPAGLCQGWLAVRELAGTEDLMTRLAQSPPPGEDEIGVAVQEVRKMHDAGVEHRDLNLGNVLVRCAESGGWEAFVIDLDRAVLHDGPLPLSPRRAALRRMERSYVKCFGDPGPLGSNGRDVWYELYAAGDQGLARKLQAGRALSLALHRLTWTRR